MADREGEDDPVWEPLVLCALAKLGDIKGGIPLKTLSKKALKYAAKISSQQHKDLKAQLLQFLRSGESGLVVEGDLVRRRPPRQEAHAAGGQPPPQKKKKSKHKSKGKAPEDAAPEVEAAASVERPAKKRRRSKHTSSSAPAEAAPEPEPEPPASGDPDPSAGPGAGAAELQRKRRTPEPPAGDGGAPSWRDSNRRRDVKSGPFSQEEKDAIRAASLEYAAAHGHSTDDLSWLFGTTRGARRGARGAWKAIAAALPQRSVKSVWTAGTRLLHPGNYQGRWSAEEDARLLAQVAERGRRWTAIGAALGRMPDACKDRWKEIRHGQVKQSGRWSAEETEALRAAVADFLAAREEGGAERDGPLVQLGEGGGAGDPGPGSDDGGGGAEARGRRVVLDDIDWFAISDRVGTRSNVQCLEKWYSQLCPSMVARGQWGAGDDRRLLRALYARAVLGGAEEWEVDWGGLVSGRGAPQARRRWRLMTKSLPGARNLRFAEAVDGLVDRFLPALKERLEAETAAGGQQGDAPNA